jgi:hypothetical protein
MGDSDEEMKLINDLDSQLKQAGCPCNEKLDVHLFQDLNAKPLAKRLKLWSFRKELEWPICFRAPHRRHHQEKQQPRHRLLSSWKRIVKRKFEEPPYVYPSAQLHDKKKPKFRYI